MQRTKRPEQIKFIQTGGGIFRLASGRIIKPKQSFKAFPDEIPEAFRDTVKPMDKDKAEVYKETGIASVPDIEFTVKSEGGGWYNVISAEGKVMNEKKLRKEDADELKEALEA